MIAEFKALSAYLIDNIGAFDTIYHYAIKDLETNKIAAVTDNGFELIFPNDRVGNYFFFLVEDVIKFKEQTALKMDNCSPAPMSATIPFSLVAIVRGCDEFSLVDVLVRNLKSFKPNDITVFSATINREAAIIQLLKGMKSEQLRAVLSRPKAEKIVIIKGELLKINYLQNCVESLICKDCN